MVSFTTGAVIAASIYTACAHFAFVRLRHNEGKWLAPTQYIRNKTSPFNESNWSDDPYTYLSRTRRYVEPTYALDMPNSVRCGRDNMAHAAGTDTLTVRAGDTIEVGHVRTDPVDWPTTTLWDNCPGNRGACAIWDFDPERSNTISHNGPFLAHLSRVPDGMDISEYDGSGEWVKIHRLGLELRDNGTVFWLPRNADRLPARFVFKLPKQTPKGKYLLRFDVVMSGYRDEGWGGMPGQIYATCAQIQVESDVSGSLPTGVKIPEIFQDDSPGMTTNMAMGWGWALDPTYVYPGGPFWDGERLIEDKPMVD